MAIEMMVGPSMHSNAIAESIKVSFNINPIIIGFILAVLCGAILIGGIKRIGRFAEKVVPLMAVIYIASAVLILIIKYQMISAAFVMIVKGAFKPMAATGSFAGNICIPRCCNFRFGRRYKKQSFIACKAGGYILRGFVCRFIRRL